MHPSHVTKAPAPFFPARGSEFTSGMITQCFVFLLYFELHWATTLAQDMQNVLKEGYSDASFVTWAHAVNSRQALEAELEGSVDFLEADVSLGHVSENAVGPPVPIMAHPPDKTSDISLERWLDVVIARQSSKGIKLDFKSIDTVEPSLLILQKHKGKLQFPLWLNADILPGPVNSRTTPVSAEKFLALCEEYFPNATLSVGWTTYWYPKSPMKNWHYSWKHVKDMADTLQCFHKIDDSPVTFPVRGIFASKSIAQLKWLLEVFPQSTLTVWSSNFDTLIVDDLVKIRESFPKPRVFYDIPEKIGSYFHEMKEEIEMKPSAHPTFVDGNYVKMTRSRASETPSCSSNSYVTNRTIMCGRDSETLVLLKEMFVATETTSLKAQGKVIFFGNESSVPSNEQPQLTLSLAEVNSFSRNFSTQVEGGPEDDMDVLWVALKSSQLHVFKHENFSDSTSCHFFQLDTTAKKPFQAWYVDCDQLREDPTAALNFGTSEVSSRKRLVLPSGRLMFGVISSGGGNVVVDDLMVTIEKSSSDSGATSSTYFRVAFLCLVLACFSVLYSLSTDQCLGMAA